jgi:hypothetical protein
LQRQTGALKGQDTMLDPIQMPPLINLSPRARLNTQGDVKLLEEGTKEHPIDLISKPAIDRRQSVTYNIIARTLNLGRTQEKEKKDLYEEALFHRKVNIVVKNPSMFLEFKQRLAESILLSPTGVRLELREFLDELKMPEVLEELKDSALCDYLKRSTTERCPSRLLSSFASFAGGTSVKSNPRQRSSRRLTSDYPAHSMEDAVPLPSFSATDKKSFCSTTTSSMSLSSGPTSMVSLENNPPQSRCTTTEFLENTIKENPVEQMFPELFQEDVKNDMQVTNVNLDPVLSTLDQDRFCGGLGQWHRSIMEDCIYGSMFMGYDLDDTSDSSIDDISIDILSLELSLDGTEISDLTDYERSSLCARSHGSLRLEI